MTEVLERQYSVQEIAEAWNISEQTVRRLFESDPDVMKVSLPRTLSSGRARRTVLRVPASAVARVQQYWRTNVVAEPKTRGRRIK